MAMNSKRNNRCSFEKSTDVSDGGGGVTRSRVEQFARWGTLAFAPLRATNEALAQGSIDSVSRATITIREDASTRLVRTTWRVQVVEDGYRTRMWNIREIQRLKRGWLRLIIETGVPT